MKTKLKINIKLNRNRINLYKNKMAKFKKILKNDWSFKL